MGRFAGRAIALLIIVAALGIGGVPVIVGIIIGCLIYQVAHRCRYGEWFDFEPTAVPRRGGVLQDRDRAR